MERGLIVAWRRSVGQDKRSTRIRLCETANPHRRQWR